MAVYKPSFADTTNTPRRIDEEYYFKSKKIP